MNQEFYKELRAKLIELQIPYVEEIDKLADGKPSWLEEPVETK